MGITDEFAAAMDAVTGRSWAAQSTLLPNKLAWACVRVLRVGGASICLATDPDLRLQVGTSSDAVGIAESLEYTTGTGPCLAAQAGGEPVWAPEAVLARRWPVYHRHLVHRTPFRAVHALPFRGGLTGIGSLDLYFRSDEALRWHDARNARIIADQVTAALLADPAAIGASEPIWLHSPTARARTSVAIATGMVVITRKLTPQDALALLRTHAQHTGSTVDEVAGRVLDGSLPPTELIAQDRPDLPATADGVDGADGAEGAAGAAGVDGAGHLTTLRAPGADRSGPVPSTTPDVLPR